MKKWLSVIYPLFIVLATLSFVGIKKCHAGRIRNLTLNPERPGTIYFSLGKATRISFPARPEKLVPGSPQSLTLDFVTANDISIIPLARNIGNLHIYTSAGDYVVLFEPGNSTNYDDAVNIRFGATTRPLRLQEDSYQVEKFTIYFRPRDKKQKENNIDVPVLMRSDGLRFESPELGDILKSLPTLRCPECVIKKQNGIAQFICRGSFKELKCEDTKNHVIFRRTP